MILKAQGMSEYNVTVRVRAHFYLGLVKFRTFGGHVGLIRSHNAIFTHVGSDCAQRHTVNSVLVDNMV